MREKSPMMSPAIPKQNKNSTESVSITNVNVQIGVYKTLVSAAITKFEGQISTWKKSPIALPCFRCLFPKEPDNSELNNCSANGVLGSVAGFLGSIQATEVVKEILGIGENLIGRLILIDSLNMEFRMMKIKRDPQCPLCGDNPTIKELIDYDQFCGTPPVTAPDAQS